MELIEGTDYYINKQGLYVFTAHYLLKRGYCCGNQCLHCPYEEKEATDTSNERAMIKEEE